MIVLAVETSGPVGSLAVRRDGRCLEERFLPELGRRHAQSLVPEAVALLAHLGVAATDVNAVAISAGPGSFTGLRVGATFAKTFAFAAAAQLVAVETFAAIAMNVPSASAVVVLADAQRGGLIAGRYVRQVDGSFQRAVPLGLYPLESIEQLVRPGDLLTGPGVPRIEDLPADHQFARPRLRLPRAAAVALLGELALSRGESVDPWTFEPLYVRKSGADEKRDAAAALA